MLFVFSVAILHPFFLPVFLLFHDPFPPTPACIHVVHAILFHLHWSALILGLNFCVMALSLLLDCRLLESNNMFHNEPV